MTLANAEPYSRTWRFDGHQMLNVLRVGDGVFHHHSGVWAATEKFKFKEINAAFGNARIAVRLRPFGRIIEPTPESARPLAESEVWPCGFQVPRRGMWPVLANSHSALKALSANMRDADVVWVTLPSMLGLAAVEANRGRKPCVAQVVGDTKRVISALAENTRMQLLAICAAHLVRRAISKVDGVIFVSEALRSAYLRDRQQRSIVANESRVRRDQLLDKAHLSDVHQSANGRPPSIAYVGRLSPEKGVHVLLEALGSVQGVNLTIIGDGPERSRLEATIEQLGLATRVRLLGSRPWGTDLLDIIRQHNALVLPSLTEGLPLVLIEAMSQGVPVIASAVGGIPELVRHGINGLLVSAGDVSQLAGAITTLTSDPDLRLRLAEEGLRSAELCTCELQWGKTVEVIMETVARRRMLST